MSTSSPTSISDAPDPAAASFSGVPVSVTVPVFVRLKLALLHNGLRQNGRRRAAYITSIVLTALFTALQLLGLIALRGHDHATALVTTAIAVLALGWAVMPLFFSAGDETLDPSRLVMLPLRPGPLMVALLLSSLIGVGPLFTLTMAIGSVVAVAHGGAAAAAGALAVVLVLLVCVALARAVATANLRLLTSRKGRDLALLSGLIIAVGFQFVNLGMQKLSGENGLSTLEPAADVLRWVPPAAAIDAVWGIGDGAYGTALGQLALTAAALVLLLVWWHRSLTRLMTAADSSTLQAAEPAQGAGARAGAATAAGAGTGARGLARLLPAGRTGTVMERTFRYAWRDPKTKTGWATALVAGLLLPVVYALQGSGDIYGACWACGLLGMQMYNQFGQDTSAFWMVAQTITGPRDAYLELRGRALALVLVGVPYVTAVVALAAALLDGWAEFPEALGMTYALLGAMLATGALSSALYPYTIPQDSGFKNVHPSQASMGTLSIFGGMLLGAVLCLPVVGVTIWLHVAGAHGLLWLVLPLGLAYGAGLTVAGLRLAAPKVAERLPEILTAVSK
ncbi:transporter [Streptomyces sp. XD-27]|uniref:transporter n=1 Tax=Streptomyces sp. XD-27 TaxID=3062779 RepID=UPI0026F46D6F|nr:transporter [Streptomyces sp. XD-27]WKX70943.1 transporter [Streptomyces sp. XD-27]